MEGSASTVGTPERPVGKICRPEGYRYADTRGYLDMYTRRCVSAAEEGGMGAGGKGRCGARRASVMAPMFALRKT